MAELSESKMRQIAKEEAKKEVMRVNKSLNKKIDSLVKCNKETNEILGRLERLLYGEQGVDEADTLRARALFAYEFARRTTETKTLDRVQPVVNWFERMSEKEKGHKHSRLESLSRMITFYDNIGWLLSIIGIATVFNAVPVIQGILQWLNNLS